MTTYIYFVRHGEVHNPKGILYSRLPRFGLTKKGRNEIQQTAAFLQDKHIDLIYSSPLLRARQTAEIIRKKLELPEINLSKILLEVRSSYQGKLFSSLSPDQREVYFNPNPGDETLEEIEKRLKKFISVVTDKHMGKRIVAVSHGDPLMMLRAVLNGLPVEYASIRESSDLKYLKHGEVFEVRIDNFGNKFVKNVFKPQ